MDTERNEVRGHFARQIAHEIEGERLPDALAIFRWFSKEGPAEAGIVPQLVLRFGEADQLRTIGRRIFAKC